MLQNNPLKSDIEQMNDWEAFKEHIQHSVDKQYDKFTRKFFVTGV